jgi:hypothetical protein
VATLTGLVIVGSVTGKCQDGTTQQTVAALTGLVIVGSVTGKYQDGTTQQTVAATPIPVHYSPAVLSVIT